MPLHVLISGAGVGGPAAAFWLTRLGHKCTVIERFAELRSSGLQIDLRKQGIDIANRMGIMDAVRARVVDEKGTQFVDTNGKVKAMFERNDPDPRREQVFTSEYEILRPDLTKILYDATKDKATYLFNLTVKDFENKQDKVFVKFSDGTEDQFDLLIAADGQGSRIRKWMVADDPALDYSRSLEMFIAYFTLPREPTDKDIATSYHAFDRRVLMTRWHSETRGQTYMSTMAHADEIRQALKEDVSKQKEIFGKIFQGAGWQTERLVQAMHESDDFYAQEVLQRKSKIWSKGRIVLLGDAGYAPSPITGMGTSLALIGAYVLAGELSKQPDDVLAALKAYDTSLRPLVDQVQDLPPGMPGLVFPSSKLGVKMLHTLLWLGKAVKVDVWAQKILSDQREAWKLPNYPALGYE